MAQKYNTGGSTTSIGEQLNDFFWSKVAVKEAKREVIFSQLGDKFVQPKHYGKTMKKYHELPIIHASNINDQGVDAAGITMTAGKWYAYTADGTRTEHDTKAAAKASANMVRIQSGDGNFYGGSKDLSTQTGAFPALTEVGGAVNEVGMKRLTLEANVTEFGHALTFTKESLDMDTEAGLLSRYSRSVGEAQGTLREAQIRTALISKAAVNATRGGTALADAEMDNTSVLTFASLRRMDKSLKDARCPKDTKLIDGSTKFGTVTVQKARYIYVGAELLPSLEDMTVSVGGVEKKVWSDVSEYASAGTTAVGEIGKIGQWRFIEVEDMNVYEGAGSDATDDTDDDADGIENTAEGFYVTDGNYDVFPMLFVGSGSFGTVGYEGDVARVTTVMPKADAHNDYYGKKGVVSISWYFGMMFLRPEWLKLHKITALEV